MKINTLCEYMKNPIGLENKKILFSWSYDGFIKQKSIRIYSFDNKGNLLFDTYEIVSEEMRKLPVIIDTLKSGVTYKYVVEAKLEDGETIKSEEATFTMGLLEEWKAMWIGGAKIDSSCYMYRSEFALSKKVKNAAAFLASPCYNFLTVNGKKADNSVLNNAFANYEKSLYYMTYDITDLIEKENAVCVTTGFGWQSLREAEDGIGWGDSLFSLEIRIEYEDESVEWILTEPENWKYSVDTPITYNSIYNGEVYDATKEDEAFFKYGYDESALHPALEREAPEGEYKSQYLEPIRVVGELKAKEIYALPDGSYTIDFGQNMVGWIKIKVKGEKGQKITLKPAELIFDDKSVNTVSLRNAHPLDIFILKGEGEEEYEPHFTYHGFRYVQVYGLNEKPTEDMFIGRIVHSDVERIGDFTSSDPILNQLYQNIIWTESGNLHSLPTDCPQRDERLGWLNDMTVRNECALYNYKLFQLYAKWMRDIRDTQGKTTGAITDTAPFMRYGFRPADSVSASFLLIPWNTYLHYGDDRIMKEHYEALKKWVGYLKRNSNNYVLKYSTMGDWAPPAFTADASTSGGGAISSITPTVLMGTGYLYYDCTLLSKMAEVLGKDDEAAFYLSESEKVKEAFNREFFNEESDTYAKGSQASSIFPLYLGIVPEDHKENVLKNLVKNIVEDYGGHLTTGNLCSRYGVEVLFQNGYEDLAWHLLTQTEYPSWGFMIANGATTVWERWEKVDGDGLLAAMATHCHPMNAAVGVCFHKYLAGIIPDEDKPGFENIILRPIVPSKAENAGASLDTVRGTVSSYWKKENGALIWNISVPLSSTATCYIPIKNRNIETLKIDSPLITVRGGEIMLSGCEFIEKTNDYIAVNIPFGAYEFKITD